VQKFPEITSPSVTFQYRICCQVGNTLKEMARLAGFEPAAYGLEELASEFPKLLENREGPLF
jgi:hypothetical protein